MPKINAKDKCYKLYMLILLILLSFTSTFVLSNLLHSDRWNQSNWIYLLILLISILLCLMNNATSTYKLMVKYSLVYCIINFAFTFLLFDSCAQTLYSAFMLNPISNNGFFYFLFCLLFQLLILAFCDCFFFLHFVFDRITKFQIVKIMRVDFAVALFVIIVLYHNIILFDKSDKKNDTIAHNTPGIWIFFAIILLILISFMICMLIRQHIRIWELEFFDLRNTERKTYDSLFDAANIICYEANMDGKFIRVSKGIERILGYDQDSLIGHSITEFYEQPEERKCLMEWLRLNEEVRDFEVRLVDQRGRVHYLSLQAKIVRENPEYIHMIGILKDNTIYREIIEKLEKYRHNYIILFEKMLTAYIVVSPVYDKSTGNLKDFRLMNANPFFFQTYFKNKKKKELLGHNWKEITATDMPELKRLSYLLKTGEAVSYETFFQNTNRYFFSNAFLLDKGRIGIIFHDITAIKNEEILKKKSEEKYRLLFEKILNGVMVMEPVWNELGKMTDVRIIDMNSICEKTIGYSRESIIGITWSELFGYKNRLLKKYEDILENDIYYRYDYFHPALKRYFNTLTFRLNENQLAGIYEDVTDQVRAEVENHQLNKELEQRVEERTIELKKAISELEAFSYTVSHDLKSPLRAISTYGQFLEEEYCNKSEKDSLEMVQSIMDISNDMIVMIDKLLQFSKIDKHKIMIASVNIANMIRDVCKVQRDINTNHSISLNIDNDNILVYADEILLREVVFNIISNAVKFSRGCEETIICVRTYQKDGMQIISFQDNGVGFDMNYVEKLFCVFQRLHTSDEFEGSGIGLATIKKIIERHGGKTWIMSKNDEGTTIYIALPLERKEL